MNPKQQEMDDRMNKLLSQRDRDTNVFQQRQQGEYIPLSFDQQQQLLRRAGRCLNSSSSGPEGPGRPDVRCQGLHLGVS